MKKISLNNKGKNKRITTLDKKIKNKNAFKTTEVLFLIIVTAIIGVSFGYILNNKKTSNKLSDNYLQEIVDNYNYIVDNYYEEIDKKELMNGAIKGMLNSLGDDFSNLVTQEDNNSFYTNLEGQYEGIGIEIINDNDNNIVVAGVIDSSPAKEAGIEIGDIIKKIDDKELQNTDIKELTKYVKNNEKSTYTMTLNRDGEEITKEIKRTTVTIKSVSSKIIEKDNYKIGYIYISVFSNVTASQFKKELLNLENEKVESMIIDVRENTGGHLTTVSSMLAELLDSTHVIYQIEKNNKITKYYSKGKKTKKYPIVILQNENSASASELFSAALKEEYGAVVIGKTSFGKGTVQEMISLSNGDNYKVTTKKWLTPKGNWINKIGVEPNIKVDLSEEYFNNPTDDNDSQLQEAIKYLTK